MSDLPLFADDLLAEESPSPRPVCQVATGLADTAEVPTGARTKTDPAPAYAPCGQCGHLVLSGLTLEGMRLAVEVESKSYVADWDHSAALPTLHESRGYPVHQCPAVGHTFPTKGGAGYGR